MLILGVPTIQIQDLKGIEQYDNEFSLRDKNGYPVNNLAFMKLVLEAKSLDDIEKHVNNILSNKDEVIKKLQVRYNNVYKTFENVNELIVKYIKKIKMLIWSNYKYFYDEFVKKNIKIFFNIIILCYSRGVIITLSVFSIIPIADFLDPSLLNANFVTFYYVKILNFAE